MIKKSIKQGSVSRSDIIDHTDPKLRSPKHIPYYGLPIFYTIEHNKTGDAAVLSIRTDADGNFSGLPKKTIYKGCARKIKQGVSVEDFVREIAPDFLSKAGKKSKVRSWRESTQPKLPLAVVWDMDRAELFETRGWSTSTLEAYDRAMNWFCGKWGANPIQSITREFCLDSLMVLSIGVREDYYRCIRTLFDYQIINGFINGGNSWDEKMPSLKSERHSRDTHDRFETEDFFDNEDCAVIVRSCFHSSAKIAIAVLLMLIYGIPAYEIAALRYNSIKFDNFGRYYYIDICGRMERVCKNFRFVAYSECNYHRRRIPITELLFNILKDAFSHESLLLDDPLVPTRKNRHRAMPPDDVIKFVKKFLGKLDLSTNSVSAYKRLIGTSFYMYFLFGMNELRVNYLLARSPKTVIEQSYIGFEHPEIQIDMKKTIDRWISCYVERDDEPPILPKLMEIDNELVICASQGKRMRVTFDARYNETSETSREIIALGGASISMCFSEDK